MYAILSFVRLGFVAAICTWLATPAVAKDQPPAAGSTDFPVAATVNGDPIYVGEVDA